MAKRLGVKLLVDCAMNPLPAQIDLLVRLASQAGYEYADAYAVWLECHQTPDPYLVIDTVLWIAHIQKISVLDALELVEGVKQQLG